MEFFFKDVELSNYIKSFLQSIYQIWPEHIVVVVSWSRHSKTLQNSELTQLVTDLPHWHHFGFLGVWCGLPALRCRGLVNGKKKLPALVCMAPTLLLNTSYRRAVLSPVIGIEGKSAFHYFNIQERSYSGKKMLIFAYSSEILSWISDSHID